jgi:hypothetical protein
VAQEIVVSAFTVILGAIALAFGLAFGLGNTALAGEIVRRWYERRRPVPEHEAQPQVMTDRGTEL